MPQRPPAGTGRPPSARRRNECRPGCTPPSGVPRPALEQHADVRRRAPLQPAVDLPGTEHPAEAEQLRRALIEAGGDLARTPAL
ncbi:hypothetical protein [Streptomyces mutabilis]|uniref:hypothetical protein n=1 Tax=Streptomyces mutabilis TaxID=67332 RepID=UPI0011462CD2|nr:hypothetical protein [Streptomyces mutabilis]